MQTAFRTVLKNSIQKGLTGSNDVALLFSGGTDSLTCLFALMDLGIKPHLYSFHLQEVIHQDIMVSKRVAEHYNLRQTIVEIPRNKNQLIQDVKYLIETFDIFLKTNVQCTYPFLYVAKRLTEKNVVTGLGADDLYGTAASVLIKSKDNPIKFNEIRLKTLSNPDASAIRSITELFKRIHGKNFIVPYRDPSVIKLMMNYNWKQLNEPKQKMLAVSAYAEHFKELPIYRKNANLQVGSKIREWHDVLLHSELNINNRKRINEVYRDYYKKVNRIVN